MKNAKIIKDAKVIKICLIVIVIAILFFASFFIIRSFTGTDKAVEDYSTAEKFTLHIGLNDKDTYKQEISDENAIKLVTDTALKYTDGFTIYKCQGVYKDKKGDITRENSLIMEFYGTKEEQVKNIMNVLLVKLNQESILLEEKNVKYKFYGKEGVIE